MSTVQNLVKEIHDNLQQKSASRKDEVSVMKAMLNDKEYKVDIYGKDGVSGTYCPAEDAREMVAGIIQTAAKVPAAEAKELAANYEFKKSDAETSVNLSKEFVNTYLETGRKLPLGGRAKSNISLEGKHVEESTILCPTKIGVGDDGKDMYDRKPRTIAAHDSVKVYGSCPAWLK